MHGKARGLTWVVIFKYRSEGGGKSHKDVWEKIIPGRGNSRCKGPVVRICQVLFNMLDTVVNNKDAILSSSFSCFKGGRQINCYIIHCQVINRQRARQRGKRVIRAGFYKEVAF